MFKISTEQPEWSGDQAAALRQFLNSPAGQVFLQRLFWFRPSVTSPTSTAPFDADRRISEADVQAGYELAIEEIIKHTAP